MRGALLCSAVCHVLAVNCPYDNSYYWGKDSKGKNYCVKCPTGTHNEGCHDCEADPYHKTCTAELPQSLCTKQVQKYCPGLTGGKCVLCTEKHQLQIKYFVAADGEHGCKEDEINAACHIKSCEVELREACADSLKKGVAHCHECTWDKWPELRASGCHELSAGRICEKASSQAATSKSALGQSNEQLGCADLLKKNCGDYAGLKCQECAAVHYPIMHPACSIVHIHNWCHKANKSQVKTKKKLIVSKKGSLQQYHKCRKKCNDLDPDGLLPDLNPCAIARVSGHGQQWGNAVTTTANEVCKCMVCSADTNCKAWAESHVDAGEVQCSSKHLRR